MRRVDLRPGHARTQQRRDLPRDDEEDRGRRLPDRGGPGASLPPASTAGRSSSTSAGSFAHGRGRRRSLGGAGRPQAAPARDRGGRNGRTAPRRAMTADYREFYRGRRVLITGGLGFIGSNLARRARGPRRRRPHRRLAAVRLRRQPLQHRRATNDRLRVNIADIRQGTTMNYLVRGREVIFNLAGQVSHIDSMRDPAHRPRDQLPQPAHAARGLPPAQPDDEGRLRRHASDLRPARSPARRRDPPRAADRHQRHQQGGGRELPPRVQQRVRRPRVLAAPDQRLRPAPAHPAQPAGLHRLVPPAGARRAARSRSTATARRCATSSTSTTSPTRCCGPATSTDATATSSTSGAASRLRTAIWSPSFSRPPARGPVRQVPWPEDKRRIDIGSFYSDSSKFARADRLAAGRRPAHGPGAHARLLPRELRSLRGRARERGAP